MENKKINICKTILVFLFVFIITLSLVNANKYWSGEANAGYEFEEGIGVDGIGYGSNYINPVSGITGNDYEICSITKSDYTPIVSNFGNLGSLKVVVTDLATDKLSIYNPDCSLFREISVGADILAMPVLLDAKNYYDQQIVVLVRDGISYGKLNTYKYDRPPVNPEAGDFVLNKSIPINVIYTDLNGLTCFEYIWSSDEDEKCIVVEDVQGDAIDIHIVNLVTENVTKISNLLASGTDYTLFDFNGLSNFRSPISLFGNEKFYIPYGFYGSYVTGNYKGGLLYYENENVIHLVDYDGQDFAWEEVIKDLSSFIAKIGNSYHIFTYKFTGNPDSKDYYSNAFISDLTGETRISVVGIEDTNVTLDWTDVSHKLLSNWVVADYDKDGSNEACILTIPYGSNEIWLQCYESTLSMGDGDIRVNYTGIMRNVSNFVLADFVPSKSVLGIATREGIFYPDEKVFSTGKNSDFGYPVTTFRDVESQIPMYVYTDNNEGFIVTSMNVTEWLCGNGICEPPYENQLSCPVDCYEEYEEDGIKDTYCKTNADCGEGLKCEYGVCSKLNFGDECSKDSDCISGNCLNGKCTKASLWQNIVASKNQQFGDDTPTNNFLSLIIILAISGVIGYYIVTWAGIMSLFMLSIFFTLVGWLSPFILIGMFIVGVIALVFGMMLGNKS